MARTSLCQSEHRLRRDLEGRGFRAVLPNSYCHNFACRRLPGVKVQTHTSRLWHHRSCRSDQLPCDQLRYAAYDLCIAVYGCGVLFCSFLGRQVNHGSCLTIRSSRDRFAARLHGDVYHSAVPRSGPA